jgi:hypothetical protein
MTWETRVNHPNPLFAMLWFLVFAVFHHGLLTQSSIDVSFATCRTSIPVTPDGNKKKGE